MYTPISKAAEKLEREQITVRLPKECYKKLKEISVEMGLTFSAALIVAIWWNVLKLKD